MGKPSQYRLATNGVEWRIEEMEYSWTDNPCWRPSHWFNSENEARLKLAKLREKERIAALPWRVVED